MTAGAASQRNSHFQPARPKTPSSSRKAVETGAPSPIDTADPDTQPTAGFKAIMREAAETRSYAAALSVLVVAEWLYLDWASSAPKPLPNNFVHAEWITLHDNPGFRGFVDFLRAELTASAPRKTSFSPVISEGFD